MPQLGHQLDLSDLVYRSKEGAVTKREISEVARLLASRRSGSDTYQLLYVIARSEERSHEALVASFISYQSDPMVAALALQTLCSFWGLTENYLQDLEQSLRGVEWDYFGDLRRVAITAAGEYLRENKSCALLGELLRISTIDDDDQPNAHRFVVEALARSNGMSFEDALDPDLAGVAWEAWAREIVAYARKRYEDECA